MILYLHGFCSSPASAKARQLGAHLESLGRGAEFRCPALSPDPSVAMAQIEASVDTADGTGAVTLVGSSLGGFYACCVAERRNLRAVLVNPALPAHLDRVPLVGEHRNFHSGEAFRFTAQHQAMLLAMAPAWLDPGRYLLLLELGDEVLDPQLTLTAFAGARQIVLPGGDHGFTRFPAQLPTLLAYADEPRTAPAAQL